MDPQCQTCAKMSHNKNAQQRYITKKNTEFQKLHENVAFHEPQKF